MSHRENCCRNQVRRLNGIRVHEHLRYPPRVWEPLYPATRDPGERGMWFGGKASHNTSASHDFGTSRLGRRVFASTRGLYNDSVRSVVGIHAAPSSIVSSITKLTLLEHGLATCDCLRLHSKQPPHIAFGGMLCSAPWQLLLLEGRQLY
jgi:hypothetical protein